VSSTYLSLHYHLVFSTKDRVPALTDNWSPRLHQYLGGTARGLGAFPQEIGGVEDHVHLLVGLKATHRLSDFMRELKKAASIWARDHTGNSHFAWQEGYAAFTVSATALGSVASYITHQVEHHRKKSFREELTELLTRAGVAYDPRYLD
jgi:putative transposase